MLIVVTVCRCHVRRHFRNVSIPETGIIYGDHTNVTIESNCINISQT